MKLLPERQRATLNKRPLSLKHRVSFQATREPRKVPAWAYAYLEASQNIPRHANRNRNIAPQIGPLLPAKYPQASYPSLEA
jgi:hypothetical protein